VDAGLEVEDWLRPEKSVDARLVAAAAGVEVVGGEVVEAAEVEIL
jgi:hypothetical protein